MTKIVTTANMTKMIVTERSDCVCNVCVCVCVCVCVVCVCV